MEMKPRRRIFRGLLQRGLVQRYYKMIPKLCHVCNHQPVGDPCHIVEGKYDWFYCEKCITKLIAKYGTWTRDQLETVLVHADTTQAEIAVQLKILQLKEFDDAEFATTSSGSLTPKHLDQETAV